MSDHNERACTNCGSLLHHESNCPIAHPIPAVEQKEGEDLPAGNQIFKIYKEMPDCPLKKFLFQWFDKYDPDATPPPVKGVEEAGKEDMTVEEFYSGFNLDFLSEEEKQTIYTATELFAKGKVRMASYRRAGRWVKAVERLPVWKEKILNHLEKKMTYNIHIKCGGLGFVVDFDHYKKEFVLTRNAKETRWGVEDFEKYNIQWLDEEATDATPDAVGFAEWIGNEDLKLYPEGWCQPGGSNGMHLSTAELYQLFLTSKK